MKYERKSLSSLFSNIVLHQWVNSVTRCLQNTIVHNWQACNENHTGSIHIFCLSLHSNNCNVSAGHCNFKFCSPPCRLLSNWTLSNLMWTEHDFEMEEHCFYQLQNTPVCKVLVPFLKLWDLPLRLVAAHQCICEQGSPTFSFDSVSGSYSEF